MLHRILNTSAIGVVVLSVVLTITPTAHAQAPGHDGPLQVPGEQLMIQQPDGSYRRVHGGNPQQNAMMQQIGLFTQMFQFVKTYTSLVGNHSEASVAALFTAKEIIGNPKEVAAYFESLLPKTENPVVVRALHMQLADHYKNSGQKDKALEHLTAIITEDARGGKH